MGIASGNLNIPLVGNVKTPEITAIQTKVTMGTSPYEWIPAAATRNIDQWNEKVDIYKIELTKQIYELLRDYTKNKNVFTDSGKISKA